jgi:hypothetical protein
VNTYALRGLAGVSTTAIEDAVTALVDFESGFLNNTSRIFRTKVWLEGTSNKFISVARSVAGERDVGTEDPLDLEFVLLVAKTPVIGRPGVSSYRDCLIENAVERANGVAALTDPTAMETAVSDNVTAHLAPYLPEGDGSLEIVKYSATDGAYVSVSTISVSGVGTRDLENRWFNKVFA